MKRYRKKRHGFRIRVCETDFVDIYFLPYLAMSLYWASKGLCISDRDSLECQMRTSFLVPLQVFLDFFLGEVFLEQKIKDVNSMISHDNDIPKTFLFIVTS